MLWFIVLGTVVLIAASAVPAVLVWVSYLRSGDEFEKRMEREYARERRMLERAGPIYPLH